MKVTAGFYNQKITYKVLNHRIPGRLRPEATYVRIHKRQRQHPTETPLEIYKVCEGKGTGKTRKKFEKQKAEKDSARKRSLSG